MQQGSFGIQNYITPINEMEKDNFGIQIKERLCGGGQGNIHLARSVSLEKDVIVKELLFGNFEREKRIIDMKHENLMECFGVWNLKPFHLIFEYIDKGDLEHVIEVDYECLKSTPIKHIKGILKGIDYIHSKDIVHLDLHPKNILVHIDKPGSYTMKICDLGLSEKQNSGNFPREPVGRPGYISPEKVGGGKIDVNSDIWSFGSILWILLTRKVAYNYDNNLAAYYSIGSYKHPDVPCKWPVLIQKIFFQCWDSRTNTTMLLKLFENDRIIRETGVILSNEMPLSYYQLLVDMDESRIVAAIEWENIDKMEVYKRYSLDNAEFECIKNRFMKDISKRKFMKIKDIIDLLRLLNENGCIMNLKELSRIHIGKLDEKKMLLIKQASKTHLKKFARVIGILDDDISSCETLSTQYFVDEIFAFWSGTTCKMNYNLANFNEIVKKIGLNNL